MDFQGSPLLSNEISGIDINDEAKNENYSKELNILYNEIREDLRNLDSMNTGKVSENNLLNYLLSANANVQPQSQIQPQPQQLIPIQNSEEIQDIQQPQENINQQEELYSQKNSEKQNQEINEEPVPQPQPEPEVVAPTNKKYAITDLGENIVDLPHNYSTDDELEFKVLNLLNEPRQNYKLACENERVQVYKKKVSNIQILLLNIQILNF